MHYRTSACLCDDGSICTGTRLQSKQDNQQHLCEYADDDIVGLRACNKTASECQAISIRCFSLAASCCPACSAGVSWLCPFACVPFCSPLAR